jgi:hypothetical protein
MTKDLLRLTKRFDVFEQNLSLIRKKVLELLLEMERQEQILLEMSHINYETCGELVNYDCEESIYYCDSCGEIVGEKHPAVDCHHTLYDQLIGGKENEQRG